MWHIHIYFYMYIYHICGWQLGELEPCRRGNISPAAVCPHKQNANGIFSPGKTDPPKNEAQIKDQNPRRKGSQWSVWDVIEMLHPQTGRLMHFAFTFAFTA